MSIDQEIAALEKLHKAQKAKSAEIRRKKYIEEIRVRNARAQLPAVKHDRRSDGAEDRPVPNTLIKKAQRARREYLAKGGRPCRYDEPKMNLAELCPDIFNRAS